MKKKGLIGVIGILFVILLIVTGFLYWFFIGRNKARDVEENLPVVQLTIIPNSVFINKKLHTVIFNISTNEKNENLTGFTVIIEDENALSYTKDFVEPTDEFQTQKVIINYADTGLGTIQKISIIPILANKEKNESIKKFITEYIVSESNFKSITCNNDGIHDIDEECDDGNLNNKDDCLYHCLLPSCGDGFVWREGNGTEQCDEGIKNSDTKPNTCRTDCTLPRCGDGVIDKEEECDLDNFGAYNNGINECSNYSLRYGSGNLNCNNCIINTSSCKKVIAALQFNGINDNVEISSLILDEDNSYTISAWVKPKAIKSETMSIIDCTNSLLSLEIIKKEYYFTVVTNANMSIEKRIDASGVHTNKWTHVVGVYDEAYVKIYVNGILRNSKSQSSKIDDNVKCRIGSRQDGDSQHFDGIIDDVRIYDKALGSTDISQLYNDQQSADSVTENLIGWWKFDDGSGSIAADSSNHNHTGVLVGDPQWVTENIN